MVELNVVEARVVGALIEKEINTPEYYPLSLNALVNACNQKSSREPVMELSEADVRTALFELDQLGLVRTIAESRATKFEHRVRDVLNLRRDEVAVICLLLLRGAQTSAELRARTERMYSFDDNAAVMTVLERLAGREEPLTQLMARQPGAREARWVHLLSGPVDAGCGGAWNGGGWGWRIGGAGGGAGGVGAGAGGTDEDVGARWGRSRFPRGMTEERHGKCGGLGSGVGII
jgi:uncharacterized protein YceH (UPF0502 family)